MTITMTRLQVLNAHKGLLALLNVPMPPRGAFAVKRAFTALTTVLGREVALQPGLSDPPTEDEQQAMVAFMSASVEAPVQLIPLGLLGDISLTPLIADQIEPVMIIPANAC